MRGAPAPTSSPSSSTASAHLSPTTMRRSACSPPTFATTITSARLRRRRNRCRATDRETGRLRHQLHAARHDAVATAPDRGRRPGARRHRQRSRRRSRRARVSRFPGAGRRSTCCAPAVTASRAVRLRAGPASNRTFGRSRRPRAALGLGTCRSSQHEIVAERSSGRRRCEAARLSGRAEDRAAGILHKTDVGGVHLDLRDEGARRGRLPQHRRAARRRVVVARLLQRRRDRARHGARSRSSARS